MATTIPGGVYRDAAGNHIDAHGKPVAVESNETPAKKLASLSQSDAETLAELEPLSDKQAAAIVAHRAKHGPFESLAALEQVDGIGPKTVGELDGLVTV